MIKLENITNYNSLDDVTIYIELLPYSETVSPLSEDQILPDDTFEVNAKYTNILDTRSFIANYLQGIVDKIELCECVKKCRLRPASDETKIGLSNYIDILITYPHGVTKDEIKNVYKITIRLSDHKDTHPEKKTLDYISIIGMKPKNLEKAVRKILKTNASKIQKDINKFEMSKFGKNITNISFDSI